MEHAQYNNCSSLEELHANNPVPVDLSAMNNVFFGVPVSTCILFVPVGSKVLYEAAPKWQDFDNIVEDAFVGMEEPAAGKRIVTILDNILIIKNFPFGIPFWVSDLSGSIIYSGESTGPEMAMPLPGRGKFLLRCGEVLTKVLNH